LFFSDCISGIRDLHQFDASIDGIISYRRISQSNTTATRKFQIQSTNQSTITRSLNLSNSNNDLFIIIEDGNEFRLAQMHSFDDSVSLLNVSCFDPPIPASTFSCSKSPHLSNLIISSQQFRACLIENPVRFTNDDIHISPQQYLDIQKLWEER
jgi:hypothetical protein